jgi:septal ring factor EnvC (AmiA/AmiB activator)
VALGAVGTLVCAAAIGFGWWAAVKTADRVNRAAERLDHGLGETDAGLARVEERLATIRAEMDAIRAEADRLGEENPELPRVKAAVERLLDRLLAAIEQAGTLAESLRAVAAGLRAGEDVVTQFGVKVEHPSRVDKVAGAIDGAAFLLHMPKARIERVKSAVATRIVRELVELAREAAAGSERLAEGLAVARGEIATAREKVAEWRGEIVFWVYAAAAANTLVWVWVGLGQLSLVGWGRRRFARPVTPPPGTASGPGG